MNCDETAKQRTLTLAAASIFTEHVIYERDAIAATRAVSDAFLIYALVEQKLKEEK